MKDDHSESLDEDWAVEQAALKRMSDHRAYASFSTLAEPAKRWHLQVAHGWRMPRGADCDERHAQDHRLDGLLQHSHSDIEEEMDGAL